MWEQKLHRDPEGNIFLDFNPILFRHLLDQLQIIEINIHPPSQPSLVEPFKKMLRKLGLQNQLRKESFKSISFFGLLSKEEKISFETMLIDLNIFVVTTTSKSRKT
jgi:hypothetical protein